MEDLIKRRYAPPTAEFICFVNADAIVMSADDNQEFRVVDDNHWGFND